MAEIGECEHRESDEDCTDTAVAYDLHPTEVQQAIADLQVQQQRITALLSRALNLFVPDGAVLPPVGKPLDYWNEEAARAMSFYVGESTFERIQRDGLPLPGLLNNEGYADPAKPNAMLRYWLFGLYDYLKIMGFCKSYNIDARRVFDFGGSTGRAFRHFYCQDDPKEVWSCDFKQASVNWCLQNMPLDIRVFLNTFLPVVPIRSGYFDVVMAFSVFTHIDEMETTWLLELKRLLRPGGIVYLTIHDETTWNGLKEGQLLTQMIRQSLNGSELVVGAPMPSERLAFRFTDASHYNVQTFHSSDYVRKNWGRFFDIVQIIPNGHEAQAVVVGINR